MNLNILRQWMDAAKEFGIGGSVPFSGLDIHGMNARNMDTAQNARRMWAERMAAQGDQGEQGQRENFFADMQQRAQPAFVRPQLSAMQPQQDEGFGRSARRPDNFLSALMGRR